MATPEANMTAPRGTADVNGNHAPMPASARHLQNFNTFQFVSQLVSATPPYLFNMSAPFPGNFFSDLLRRMAPRAGTPGMPPDASLQQHIRAALLAKGTPPPNLPQSVMPPPLDLAAIAAQQRHQQQNLSSSQDKGLKRSLFSDISALSSCEEEMVIKRQRLDDSRDDRRDHHPEGLTSPFLLQPHFLPSAVPHPQDVMSPWAARASMMRPQMPIPSHVPPAPLDPYRLLLDLRLAGQLRSMAATQALHHKEAISIGASIGHPPLIPSITSASRVSPLRENRLFKEEPSISTSASQSSTTLRGDDSRVSAFHPPGRMNDIQPEMSDEEGGERRSNSRNSSNSNGSNKDGLGPQYILKHLTDIYRTIDIQRNDNQESDSNDNLKNSYHSLSKNPAELSGHIEADKSNNNGGDCQSKTSIYKDEPPRNLDCFTPHNGHSESRRTPSLPEGSRTDAGKEKERDLD